MTKEEITQKAGDIIGAFTEGVVDEALRQFTSSIVTSSPEPEEIEVPDGYELLPAGPTRYVGVNTEWLKATPDRKVVGPIRVENENGDSISMSYYSFGDTFDEVQILGSGRLVGWEHRLVCGFKNPGRSVRIETTAALLVKAHKS